MPAGIKVLDRFGSKGASHEAALLTAFDKAVQGPQVLMAFSLGAMSALMLAARRPERVAKVMLFSPAAPLELGDFLPQMAGRTVFGAARMGRWPLQALSSMQSMLASLAPDMMLDTMFGACVGPEKELSRQPMFRQAVLQSIRSCLTQHRAAYARELLAYVQPWSPVLDDVKCEVQVWHGSADGWAPPSMAEALQARLAGRVSVSMCAGLGHYTTLHAQLPRLLRGSAQA